MRRSLLVGLMVAALALPATADALPLATSVSLPKLPVSDRPFTGFATKNATLIWRDVGPRGRAHVRIWRLIGRHWRVVVTADRSPQVLPNGTIDACPFESTNGGRSFRRYARPCHSLGLDVPKTVVVNGTSYRSQSDLNAMLFMPAGASGWTPTATAFTWEPFTDNGESVSDFAVLGDPLRLILYRQTRGSRGTSNVRPYRSLDGGATWLSGTSTPGRILGADSFGGGRLYDASSFSPDTFALFTTWLRHSNDLGATWATLVLQGSSKLSNPTRLELGPRPGLLAVVGDLIWVSDNGAVSARSVAPVPAGWRISSTPGNFGSWLLIGKRSIRRVTLTP